MERNIDVTIDGYTTLAGADLTVRRYDNERAVFLLRAEDGCIDLLELSGCPCCGNLLDDLSDITPVVSIRELGGYLRAAMTTTPDDSDAPQDVANILNIAALNGIN